MDLISAVVPRIVLISLIASIISKRGAARCPGQALIESIATGCAKAAAKVVEVKTVRPFSTETNPDAQMAENRLANFNGEPRQLQRRR